MGAFVLVARAWFRTLARGQVKNVVELAMSSVLSHKIAEALMGPRYFRFDADSGEGDVLLSEHRKVSGHALAVATLRWLVATLRTAWGGSHHCVTSSVIVGIAQEVLSKMMSTCRKYIQRNDPMFRRLASLISRSRDRRTWRQQFDTSPLSPPPSHSGSTS